MTDAGKRNPSLRFRIWDGTKTDLTQLGKDEGFAPATLIGDVSDLLAGYYRCPRCGGTPVPVEFGCLQGRPLRDWVAEAESAVRHQKCNAHHPVLVGAETASSVPVAAGTAEPAATREGDAGERTEPPAPDPAKDRKASRKPRAEEGRAVSAFPRPAAAPPLVAAESTPAATAARLAADVPGVGLASDLPRTATAVFQEPLGQRREEHPVPVAADQTQKRGRKGLPCEHRMQPGAYCRQCGRIVP